MFALGQKRTCDAKSSSALPLTAAIENLVQVGLIDLSILSGAPKRLKPRSGPVVLWTSIIISAISAVVGIAAAWRQIPWYAAVIGGGAAILLAPMALQFFPDRIVDGRSALIGFAAAAAIFAALLCWLTVP